MKNLKMVFMVLILIGVLALPNVYIIDTPILGQGKALAFINLNFGAKEEKKDDIKSMVKDIYPKDKLITQAKEVAVKKGNGEEYKVKLRNVGKNSIVVELNLGGDKKVKLLRRVLRMPQFKDVYSGHWAKKEIELSVAAGLLSNEKSMYFRPDGTMSREKFAKILVRALGIKAIDRNVSVAPDVPASSKYAKYINYVVKTREIMELDLYGYFNPSEKISRSEAIVAICNIETIIRDWEMHESPFEDLPPRHRHAKFISAAKKEGLLEFAEKRGYLDADGHLTYAELSVLLSKTKMGKRAIARLLDWENGYGVNVDKRSIVALSR